MRSYLNVPALVVTALSLTNCGGSEEPAVSSVSQPLINRGGSALLTYSSDWKSGYCADVKVTNGAATPAVSWTVVLELHQAKLNTSWNTTVTQDGTRLTATPTPWNAAIPPGGSVSFGFCGASTGADYHPTIESVVVSDGSTTTVNVKDPSAYGPRDVFLVGDSDWRRVFTTVPAAIWTESGGTKKNPLLVFHDETSLGGGFDAEAALHFLGEYGAGAASPRLHLLGTLPTELQAALPASWTKVQHADARDLWQSIRDVVYVSNDYQSAMLAAPYAALINAPLLIQGYNDNLDLTSRRVTCVGLAQAACAETLSLEQLRSRYLQTTNTNKVILTRPVTDLYASNSLFAPPSTSAVSRLFGASSLVAPILAAAKQELILSIDAQVADTVDAQLDAMLTSLALKPRYLTILASPLEIQQTIGIQRNGTSSRLSIDASRYGNLDNDVDGFAESKTGRIYGLTSGDTSTYVARAIHYAELPLPNPDQYLLIGQGASPEREDETAASLAQLLSSRGGTTYRTYADPTVPADWANRTFINDASHGSEYWAGIAASDMPWLSSTAFLSASCLTCAFDYLTSDMSHFFCTQLLRRGAIGAIVSVDLNGFVWDGTRINTAFSSDLGAVTKAQQNYDHARSKWYDDILTKTYDHSFLKGDIQFLLGDPTVVMRSAQPILPGVSTTITPVATGLSLDITVPSITMTGPTHYLFMEGTDEFKDPSSPLIFSKVGPMPAVTVSAMSSSDVLPATDAGDPYKGIRSVASHDDIDGKYWYLMYEKDLSANPVGVVASNRIHVNVTK